MSNKNDKSVRKRRSPEASKENILQAAETLLVEQGPQALLLTDVAKASGVANATVLHHFGTIDGVHKALMERMIARLVDRIVSFETSEDINLARAEIFQALFDTFEAKGTARLAAWLELTGEARRLSTVREAVGKVILEKKSLGEFPTPVLEDIVLIAVTMALGMGLWGNTLEGLLDKPEGRGRELAVQMLLMSAVTILGE